MKILQFVIIAVAIIGGLSAAIRASDSHEHAGHDHGSEAQSHAGHDHGSEGHKHASPSNPSPPLQPSGSGIPDSRAVENDRIPESPAAANVSPQFPAPKSRVPQGGSPEINRSPGSEVPPASLAPSLLPSNDSRDHTFGSPAPQSQAHSQPYEQCPLEGKFVPCPYQLNSSYVDSHSFNRAPSRECPYGREPSAGFHEITPAMGHGHSLGHASLRHFSSECEGFEQAGGGGIDYGNHSSPSISPHLIPEINRSLHYSQSYGY